jgi:hypothetical protein
VAAFHWGSLFAAVGVAYMFLEIAQLQHYNLVLGHPTTSLIVILPSLLTGTGIGSLIAGSIIQRGASPAKSALILFSATVLIAVTIGLVTPALTSSTRSWPQLQQCLVAALSLVILGIGMGFCFPTALTCLQKANPELIAWAWGINGACSVVASAGATLISLFHGISASYWTGVCCYIAALLLLKSALRARTAE